MFTEKDLNQFKQKGIELQEIEEQLEMFGRGIDFVYLVKPATPGDGIEVFEEEQIDELAEYFSDNKDKYSFGKFVPASGAASRMFKDLFAAYEKSGSESGFNPDEDPKLKDFFDHLEDYPFYETLKEIAVRSKAPLNELRDNGNYRTILELILTPRGLNYGNLPKGLLKFHSYENISRTAFEEHFEEASQFLDNEGGNIRMHFTVSPEHMDLFKDLSKILTEKYRDLQGLMFDVSFSIQKPSTDTIAVDTKNAPFRLENENILFRPGGHGALIDNLNDLDESLIFVGNIDNVAPDWNKPLRVKYKKFLGGFLIRKREKIHTLLDRIDRGERGESLQRHILDTVSEISPVFAEELSSEKVDNFNEKTYRFLNRPMRVCGMVKNVGEPGGGPFWIRESSGRISKQVIESSQINMEDHTQKERFMSSTHFNPVDLVCYIRDHKGEPFNLKEFVDQEMAFIAQKSQNGKDLKALERPGLWNGSMAGWLTWFVDVPLETFSPVKTVFDLVRPEHSAK